MTIKQNYIKTILPSDMPNHNGKTFIRKRQLPLGRLLTILLHGITKSLQIQLDDYYEAIGCKEDIVSKQAFSKARTELDPVIVKRAFELTTEVMCKNEEQKLYKGKYRLCAVDGSTIMLDNSVALKEHFGVSGRGNKSAMAMVSLCYDPLNNVIMDGSVNPVNTVERETAKVHTEVVEQLPKLPGTENLYIYDRGYASKERFAELINAGIKFMFRVRKKFNLDFDNVNTQDTVTFTHGGKRYSIRVINITLSSGETEILATNLDETELPYDEAGELYFKLMIFTS